MLGLFKRRTQTLTLLVVQLSHDLIRAHGLSVSSSPLLYRCWTLFGWLAHIVKSTQGLIRKAPDGNG